MSKVIKSWTFLEMITPAEVPSLNVNIKSNLIKGNKRFKSVVPISQSAGLLNQVELVNPIKNMKRYTYYMNTYTKHDLVVLLRDYFKNEEEIINKSTELYYSFTFDVNGHGDYVADSLFIPYVQLIVDDIQRERKISYDDFSDRYTDKKIRFEEELQVIFQNEITEIELQSAERLFADYFSSVTKDTGRSYVQCLISNKGTPLSEGKFNSFFLDDLQTILQKGENKTLSQFAKGEPMQVDINENQRAIEDILSLENLPLGRWPSPVNHRLSLMQQVAVNQIFQGEELIHSINGPPGTGKTTLLKDVFAQVIVERSIQMSRYDDPTKAFSEVGKQSIEMSEKEYSYNMYELAPEIGKYSMVVPSCNNEAVENNSKELPLLEEIIRRDKPSEEERENEIKKSGIDPIIFYEYDCIYAEEAEKLDYLTTYAENLLEDEKAWGVFSGAFGKRRNIQRISNSLQNKKNGQIPLLEYLQQTIETNAWYEAVKEFNDLREEIEQDRKEINHFIKTMKHAEEMLEDAKKLPQKITENKERKTNLT